MNDKGFAVTGILYTVLVIFLVSITIMLYNLQNRKTILDTLKADTVEAVEENNNFDYLNDRINELEGQINTLNDLNNKLGELSLKKLQYLTTDNTSNEIYFSVVPKKNTRYLAVVTYTSSNNTIAGVAVALMTTSMDNALSSTFCNLGATSDSMKITAFGPHGSGNYIQLNRPASYSTAVLYEIVV